MEKSSPFPWEFDGETVAFETPEQTRVEYRVAPFGSRIAAAVIDNLVVLGATVVIWLIVLLVLAFLPVHASVDLVEYVVAAVMATQFLLSVLFFVVCEVRGEGRTPGKRRLGIRTILMSGQGLTIGASLVRNLARLVDNFPLFWLVPALTRGRRRSGDLLAGTLVVLADDPAAASRRSGVTWLVPDEASLGERQYHFTAAHAERLYADDLNLLEHLAARIWALQRSRRGRVLEEVATKYVERLGLESDRERILEDPKRFLQELGVFLRQRFEGQAY